MTKRLLLQVALLALSVAPARAAGINLGWDDCPGGATYSATKTFACDTNTGINILVVSFVAPAGVEAMSANEIVIDFMTAGATIPDWWKFRTGLCRPASLRLNVDFTAGPFTCYDYWQGGAVGAISQDTPGSSNWSRIKALSAMPAGSPLITSIPEGTHVYSCKVTINNLNSVGLGSCAGCGVEVCMVLQSLRLNQPTPLPQIDLYTPATVRHVIWQGWSNPNPNYGCPASIVPVKQRTWGSIKAQYR